MPDAEWTRERQSFSCTDEVWDAAKRAWSANLDSHPAWTDWLEHALDAAAQRVYDDIGELKTAPARIPPGRRSAATPGGRRRRSFTCRPDVWTNVRNAWWTQVAHYPQLSDWIETAIATQTDLDTHAQKGRTP